MSRIGKQPITIPESVTVRVDGRQVTISGPKGELSYSIRSEVKVVLEEDKILVQRTSPSQLARALHGTVRSILANAVCGVTDGYEKRLVLKGLGYRAEMTGGDLVLEVGFSHPVRYSVSDGVTVKIEGKDQISVTGVSKEQVGRVAAEIRATRPPEPYQGSGIRYEDEVVRRKAGKAAKVGEGFGT